ncbi:MULTISPECIES: amidase [unclassified Rhodococcus (in: high G+C Gram-positive bacteria)]|uniref:amidase n=1 Tax=unclassified Rhodococcus (in: high G+C Gram-positive bacteria) TaxID=192944 RepID=UPI001639D827|nr:MULTISPECIES: amidase [unclassified Rhodococcus (in: high G+C Gram-positive bacteria)]MBC2640561.1 amidase [Rhodococcus sp. 3A]MBC2894693.1 amidase [Rhodococcus sp. 4CII]
MTSLPAPDSARLAALNEHFRFGLSAADLEEFAPAVEATLTASIAVEQLYERAVPPVPERSWAPPAPEHDRLGAWYVTTEIAGSTEGPLAGRTVAVKDNVAVAGVPMMNGSRTVEGFVPRHDATVVRRLLDAGATIAGKSVCEDLCFSGGSFTSQPGPVRNPWDITRNSGGSSSGSGALVARGEVDLAVGGDQGGSIRIPAAFCGIVGHKPTHGLVPYTGAFPIERTIDHLGPMTRTVADAATMLSVLAGTDGADPRQSHPVEPVDYAAALTEPTSGLRVGVVSEGFGTAVSDPEVDAAVRASVEVLRGAGLAAEPVSIRWHLDAMHVWNVIATEGAAYQMLDGNAYGMNTDGFYDPELVAHFARQRLERGHELSKTVKLVGLSGRYTFEIGGGKYYAMARQLVPELRAAYDAALADFDVLVMPTVPYTARQIPPADVALGDYLDVALSMVGNTAPFDVTGHPACSVPAGLVGGLPTGMMIIGKRFDDATVLRVAHTYELAVGGFPTPPVTAAVGTTA